MFATSTSAVSAGAGALGGGVGGAFGIAITMMGALPTRAVGVRASLCMQKSSLAPSSVFPWCCICRAEVAIEICIVGSWHRGLLGTLAITFYPFSQSRRTS